MSARRSILIIGGDDIGVANLSCYSDGLMGHRSATLQIWMEPYTELRRCGHTRREIGWTYRAAVGGDRPDAFDQAGPDGEPELR